MEQISDRELENFLDRLTPRQRYVAIVYLSVLWAEQRDKEKRSNHG